MRSAVFAGLVMGLVIPGLALEMASPLFLLPSEPLILYTEKGESPPVIKDLAGSTFPLDWDRSVLPDGRTRWEACLAGLLPEGVWRVSTDRASYTFLLVNPFFTIVEVLTRTASKVRILPSSGQRYCGDSASGVLAVFILRPAHPGEDASIEAILASGGYGSFIASQKIKLSPSTRVRVFLPEFILACSSEEVVPGSEFLIGVRPILSFSAAIELLLAPEELIAPQVPRYWKIEAVRSFPDKCGWNVNTFLPLLKVTVPRAAQLGSYQIPVSIANPEDPRYRYTQVLEVRVSTKLPPIQVIGHWNVKESRLDFTQPFSLTFERMLWGASLLGKTIPYTDTVMTEELLRKVAEEWASSTTR